MKFLKQTFHILYGHLNMDEKHSVFPPWTKPSSIVQDGTKIPILVCRKHKKPNKAMNLQSGCERDEENPTEQQDCNLFPLPPRGAAVPEEALAPDCTARQSYGNGNLHLGLGQARPPAPLSLTAKTQSKSCLHPGMPPPMGRALLHLLHLSWLGIHEAYIQYSQARSWGAAEQLRYIAPP